MLKILINGLQISDKNTGVQYYTQNLHNELRKLNNGEIRFHLMQFSSGNSRHSRNTRLKRIWFENFSLPIYYMKNNFSLYHSPNYVLPCFSKIPSALTIHDLITFDYPELCQYESVLYFRLLLARSAQKATKIIAVSNTVKNDILRHFNIPSEKIEVIYHGVNPIFKKTIDESILNRYHLPEKYILFVGNIEPKKNLERLIKAFDRLKRDVDIPHKMVIAGKKGWKYNPVLDTVVKLKLEKEIIFPGYVPEEDLPAVYSMSDLFVFPSLYEGFGIPPLEAMACEIPVLTSNRGALPEITGGKCLQVDPFQIDEIAQGMFKIITDHSLKQQLISGGKEWVKQFSWEKTAKETLSVYEQALRRIREANNK